MAFTQRWRPVDRGLFHPAEQFRSDTLSRFERWWKTPVQFVLLLFGFANAGVPFTQIGPGTYYVLAALVFGKPIGILLSTAAARLAGAHLPSDLRARDLLVLGITASIGFTVSLFFATAAFHGGTALVETSTVSNPASSLPAIEVLRLQGMVCASTTLRYTSASVLTIASLALSAATTEARGASREQHMTSVTQMMTALASQSAQAGVMIRDLYGPYLDFLVLNGYDQIEGALGNGGLVLLPDPHRFNVIPRLEGSNPIGEKDLDNQASYLSARAATIGCLLQVASRVTSGPVEVTSLVRHTEYQDALRATNVNAITPVPMHTMGLAFDIAIVNTSLRTVMEVRDVLEEMRDAGDILFVAERRQLVFHVVPHPSRLGYFTDVYARALETGIPSGAPLDIARPLVPRVTTAITALWPTPEYAAQWWESDNVAVDLAVAVTPEPPSDVVNDTSTGGFTDYFERLGELMVSTWARMTRAFSGAAVS